MPVLQNIHCAFTHLFVTYFTRLDPTPMICPEKIRQRWPRRPLRPTRPVTSLRTRNVNEARSLEAVLLKRTAKTAAADPAFSRYRGSLMPGKREACTVAGESSWKARKSCYDDVCERLTHYRDFLNSKLLVNTSKMYTPLPPSPTLF